MPTIDAVKVWVSHFETNVVHTLVVIKKNCGSHLTDPDLKVIDRLETLVTLILTLRPLGADSCTTDLNQRDEISIVDYRQFCYLGLLENSSTMT
jgi:hypothetical protein